MKIGKATGHDKVTPEIVKYIGEAGNKLQLHTIRLAWKYKKTMD